LRRAFQDLFHGTEVISFHFHIGHIAISFGGGYPIVAQQILDAFHLGIGIEQLGGHGVAQVMTADL
jgi:hypothetical protein